MKRSKPLTQIVVDEMVSKLSFQTKLSLYQDLKETYTDEASDAGNSGHTVEEIVHDFACMIFHATQHRLLSLMEMSDEEIDDRIY